MNKNSIKNKFLLLKIKLTLIDNFFTMEDELSEVSTTALTNINYEISIEEEKDPIINNSKLLEEIQAIFDMNETHVDLSDLI